MEFFRQFNVSFRQTKNNKEERRGKSEPRKPEFKLFFDKGFKVDIFKAQKFLTSSELWFGLSRKKVQILV